MALEIIQLPQWQDNYAYLIADPVAGEAAVVDAPEPGRIPELLKEKNWQLKAIFNTHHHPDHIGANRELIRMYPGLEIYGHQNDAGRITGMNRPVDDGDTVRLGSETAEVLFVPGHTSGHIAYRFGGDVFVGDTLFAGGCGRLFEGTAVQMHRSLSRLAALPAISRVWCAHEYTESNLRFAVTIEPGNRALAARYQKVRDQRTKGVPTVPSTIGEEKETNVFLRWDSPEIIERCRETDPGSAADPAQRFAIVRKLKDRF
ncbi:MAG: hydroxyacylglutathione hydrolase [Deltaproteobacteria bacterium]|nr:hydroxyacylglutathione hydrolase [Deltaproteobacteria bacterium]